MTDWIVEENGIQIGMTKEGNLFFKNIYHRNPKNLGKISIGSDTRYVWCKSEKEIDKFLKTNAWSLPYVIFERLPEDAWIRFITESYEYVITVRRIKKIMLKENLFLHFKSSGVEKKIYVPIKYWDVKPLIFSE